MEPNLGEYWWIVAIGSFIGGLLVPLMGYYTKKQNGQKGVTNSTIHGSAVIDSAVGRDVMAQIKEQAAQTRRLADAAEGLLEIEHNRERQEQRRREAEHEDAIRERDALRRKLDAQERGKR